MAVGVGSVRGSAVKMLRPVGSTSRRSRAASRPGPAAHAVPSSAAMQRCALGVGARRPCRVADCRIGAAVDVLAVLDREVLEIAQPGIDPRAALRRRRPARQRRPRARARCVARPRRSAARAARGGGGRGRRLGRIRRPAVRVRARRRTMSASTSGGGRWPIVTAAMRRLACAASPGLLTMNG